jgi:hypothetical protein
LAAERLSEAELEAVDSEEVAWSIFKSSEMIEPEAVVEGVAISNILIVVVCTVKTRRFKVRSTPAWKIGNLQSPARFYWKLGKVENMPFRSRTSRG